VADLTPITPNGAEAPRVETFGALTLSENTSLALASLALGRDAQAPAPFGLALPGPGRWQRQGTVAAFWSGHGQWMIEADGRAETDFAAELASAAPGAAVTEQTDGWVIVEIVSADGAAPILQLTERLVNLDLAVLGQGYATRTLLEHMSVYIIRRAEDRLAILGMRSAAGSLWHALATAARRMIGPGPADAD
jgi:heterotetrameric sarcosine oxidase gamma subunit